MSESEEKKEREREGGRKRGSGKCAIGKSTAIKKLKDDSFGHVGL